MSDCVKNAFQTADDVEEFLGRTGQLEN